MPICECLMGSDCILVVFKRKVRKGPQRSQSQTNANFSLITYHFSLITDH